MHLLFFGNDKITFRYLNREIFYGFSFFLISKSRVPLPSNVVPHPFPQVEFSFTISDGRMQAVYVISSVAAISKELKRINLHLTSITLIHPILKPIVC